MSHPHHRITNTPPPPIPTLPILNPHRRIRPRRRRIRLKPPTHSTTKPSPHTSLTITLQSTLSPRYTHHTRASPRHTHALRTRATQYTRPLLTRATHHTHAFLPCAFHHTHPLLTPPARPLFPPSTLPTHLTHSPWIRIPVAHLLELRRSKRM
jgi:hypothetical protein